MKKTLVLGRARGKLPFAAFASCAFLCLVGQSSEAQLAEGLIAYYPLDGNINDAVGPYHGEAQPDGTNLTFDDGQIGQGVDLDGTDQFIELTGTEEVFNFQETPGFTASMWFRVDNFGKSWQALAAKGEGNRWRIHRRGDTNTMTGNGGNADVPETTVAVDDGGLHHLALVSTAGENVLLYIDGEMVSEGPAPTLEQNTMPVMLGENPDARGRTWDGLIDDVGFWNRPLPEDEIIQIYEGGLDGKSILELAAPEFFIDFDDNPVPQGVEIIGTSQVRDMGGVDDSGYLAITDAVNSERGAVIFPDLTGGQPIAGFEFEADLRVGGGTADPADGFSINLVRPNDPLLQDPRGGGFAASPTDEADLPEEGSQTGLGIGFDEWFSGGEDVIGFSVRVDNELVTQIPAETKNGAADDASSLQTGPDADNLTWQPFKVTVTEREGGGQNLNLWWKGEQLITDLAIDYAPGPGQMIFAGRTGGANSNHHADNIRLKLIPARLAQIAQLSGNSEMITGTLSDGQDSQIVRDSWTLSVDGTDVTGDAVFNDLGNEIRFTYTVSPPFDPGSTHTIVVEAEDNQSNTLTRELILEVPATNWVAGGQWTTTHAYAAGDTINSTDLAKQLTSGELDNQGIITVPTEYIHFDDNAGPPLFGDLSRPYPLWDPENGGTGRGDRNQFAIYSHGQIVVTEAGTYWFVCNSDDGFSLEIDGTEVGNAGDRGRANTFMEVALEAGVHDVDFWHWENGGGAGVSVYVSREPSPTQPQFSEFNYELLPALDILNPPTDGTLPDTDGDNLPDIWEIAFFGDLSRDGSGDFDEDGLNDADELANQANPSLKDTDGDGLEDGPEVHTHGSSPALVDTDGDTLNDFDEVTVYNTDPADADSDGDGAIDPVEVNPEFDTDPNDPNSVPDVIVASQSGPWMAPSTWGGTAPTAGNRYAALAGVSDQLVTTAGTFAGDALILIGAELSLEHTGTASANLSVSNGTLTSRASNTLGGSITFTGDSIVNVGGQTLKIDAQLNGSEGVTFTGGAAEPRGNVEISGPASTLTGQINILGTFVSLLSPNGLGGAGEGDVLLSGGGLAAGAETKFCGDLLIQGDNFVLALGADITVKDLKGLDAEGGELFSLHGAVGNASLSATDLQGAGFNADQVTGDAFLILDDAVECSPPGCDDPEADSDSDGVTDCDETLVYGTDPNNADTDNDGVDDGTEVADGTNPKAADTDQDGLSDSEEKTLGTDPTQSDSDGDGFPDGVENDLGTDPTNSESFPDRFTVRTLDASVALNTVADARAVVNGTTPSTETVTFEKTINYTDDLNNTAVIPGDKLFEGGVVDDFVVHVTGAFTVPEDGMYSIGFNSDDGGQILIDGEEFAVFDANRGRNNTIASGFFTAGNHQIDAIMWERGGGAAFEIFWSPGEFTVANGGIPAGMTPVALEAAVPALDEDGDGLNDAWEIEHFGDITSQDGTGDPDADGADNLAEQAAETDPNNPDTDGDGLNDGDELAGPTDPLLADTDGDTLNDGDEVAGGTDPLSRDSDGDGYSDVGDPEPTNAAVPASAGDFLVVDYDFNEGTGTSVTNGVDDGTAEILNGHDAMWNESGSGADGSGYLTFNEDGDGATAMHIDTGVAASDLSLTEVGSEYTMMAWMNVANAEGDNMIFGQAVDENVLHNGTRGAAYHQGHWGNDITGGTTEVGAWHHVAYRYQAGVQTIFVDGVEVAGAPRGPLQSMANIVIGTTRATLDDTDGRDFTGDLDEVKIYSVGLPLEEILIAAGLVETGQPFVFDPSFAIPDGTTYDVEYSTSPTSLQEWETIATGQTGVFVDDDPGRNANREGFYRAVYEP